MSRSALYPVTDSHPIPADVWMPKGVIEPAAQARALYERCEQEVVAVRSLRKRADEAAVADRYAARQAAAAGEPMPERTEPGFREEAAEAWRRAEALEGAVRDALVDQAQAVAASHDEWTKHIRGDLDTRATKILRLLGRLHDEFAALEADAATAQTLERFDGHPRWLQIGTLDAKREQRQRETAERGERFRKPSGYVDSDRHALIAALNRLVADIRPSS